VILKLRLPFAKGQSGTTGGRCGENSILLPVALFATAACLLACKRDSLDFGSRGTKYLSRSVVLHRTSAKSVVVTGRDDFGIVPGSVQRISTLGPVANSIVVEFVPFESKSPPAIEFALIDLRTGKVQTITHQEAAKGTKFVTIDESCPLR
jgi:hypothetical protein